MKKLLTVFSLLVVAVLLLGISSSQAADAPDVKIRLRKLPPVGLLELDVGESHTFEVHISSDEPFVIATAMTDSYYPGRGVSWSRSNVVNHDNYAVITLTVTGKASTSGLFAVCDWPEPGYCWPEGVAPVSIVAGARFSGGMVVAEAFTFAIIVP